MAPYGEGKLGLCSRKGAIPEYRNYFNKKLLHIDFNYI